MSIKGKLKNISLNEWKVRYKMDTPGLKITRNLIKDYFKELYGCQSWQAKQWDTILFQENYLRGLWRDTQHVMKTLVELLSWNDMGISMSDENTKEKLSSWRLVRIPSNLYWSSTDRSRWWHENIVDTNESTVEDLFTCRNSIIKWWIDKKIEDIWNILWVPIHASISLNNFIQSIKPIIKEQLDKAEDLWLIVDKSSGWVIYDSLLYWRNNFRTTHLQGFSTRFRQDMKQKFLRRDSWSLRMQADILSYYLCNVYPNPKLIK
jgi:hypothetical protein